MFSQSLEVHWEKHWDRPLAREGPENTEIFQRRRHSSRNIAKEQPNIQNKADKGSFTPGNVVAQYQIRFMRNYVDRTKVAPDILPGIAVRENIDIIILNEPNKRVV